MVDCISLGLVLRACSPCAEAFTRLREPKGEAPPLGAAAVIRIHTFLRSLDDACELATGLARVGKLPEALAAQRLAEDTAGEVLALVAASERPLAALLAGLDWDRVDSVARDLRWFAEEDYRTVESGHGNIDAFRELLTLVRRELERKLFE